MTNSKTRVPPHNGAAEEALLGAMLHAAAAVEIAIRDLNVDDFYFPKHQSVFLAIVNLHAKRDPIDPITVAEELRQAGMLDDIGGEGALVDLQAATPSIGNAPKYAKMIRTAALNRRLINAAGEAAELGYNETDAEEAVDKAQQLMFGLSFGQQVDYVSVYESTNAVVDRWEAIEAAGGGVIGTRTGIHDLDELLDGAQPGSLIVIGGRPSIGKSAVVECMATNIAMDEGLPVLYVSAEMPNHEVTMRMYAQRCRIDARRIKRGSANGGLTAAEYEKFSKMVAKVTETPFYIVDRSLSVARIGSLARRLKAEKKALGAIVVDYLQLLPIDGRNLQSTEVGANAQALKQLAMDLEVPVICAAQVSRGVEARADKRPMMADLKDSGGIEQAADVVITLYRDEFYNPESADKGIMELIVAKNRHGSTGVARVAWLGAYTAIANMAKFG